ncbi:polysaccharide export protein [Babesia caballi]|uniref:Polysaccharide export protein n=1 Tax=Babesia caballi TaxID=5871 RepID=A0AAV4LP47_BABCB|nr:polysaccharide export protein [Babesia caballi]
MMVEQRKDPTTLDDGGTVTPRARGGMSTIGTEAFRSAMVTANIYELSVHLTKPFIEIVGEICHPGKVCGSSGWGKGGAIIECEGFEITAAVFVTAGGVLRI